VLGDLLAKMRCPPTLNGYVKLQGFGSSLQWCWPADTAVHGRACSLSCCSNAIVAASSLVGPDQSMLGCSVWGVTWHMLWVCVHAQVLLIAVEVAMEYLMGLTTSPHVEQLQVGLGVLGGGGGCKWRGGGCSARQCWCW
jgi:hypothetical protein